MTREVELIEYLPQVFKDVEEMQEIMKVESGIINSLWQNTQNVYDDTFILTSTDYGLDRRYRFLGMPIIPGEDIDTRRFKVMARYQEQAPYTWRSLHKLLDSLVGAGNYVLNRNVADKTLNVKLELTKAGEFGAVVDLLERIVPQEMVITVDLRFNTWNQIKAFTWDQLKVKTWGEVKEGVL